MATRGSNPDVVIVGGGFAGVTAARELMMRGRSAALVEARDRLSGRTYTSDHDGHATVLPDLRASEGRLFFAGGDSAIAGRSSIDGAIEGGYRPARDIDDYLTAGQHQARPAAEPARQVGV